jgi:hypothetical protein
LLKKVWNDQMSLSLKTDSPARRCSACGAELPPQKLSAQLCPKCLLEAGLATQPVNDDADHPLRPKPTAGSKGFPQPGETFGHYQIIRLLGQGGMGVVYEADDLESGRRVALKLLSQALDSPEARKRFLREGQLAASINHPNSVYVFGTEEVAGTPVIAMELMTGGTLRDRVIASGPMSASEAVDCLLQVITGLEAAQQAGILHRDIKPSNCFFGSDGTVKIGDFGLSIATDVRTESNLTAAGTLFGTPAFSSPEQLRGDELTFHTDIYAVGATLYYLLTGQTPFEGANPVQFLATVLERRPESPAKWRKGLSAGLCRVVLRCLEKDPRSRYDSYARLRGALLPFSSAAPVPSGLGLRFLAGCADLTLVGLFSNFCQWLFQLAWTPFYPVILLYFTLAEGIWGTSLGKAIFHLRVVRVSGAPPRWPRALLRTVIFIGLSLFGTDLLVLLFWRTARSGSDMRDAIHGVIAIFILFGLLALLFAPARKENGFAALHDRLSRTRVALKSASPSRQVAPACPASLPNLAGTPQLGPYHILEKLSQNGDEEILMGFDPRLLRNVWIRKLPSGTPTVGAELRNLGRPGRLRWLTGKRSAAECWDAYEAAPGQPLVNLLSQPRDWSSVRFWLLDLAEELRAAAAEGSMPRVLSLDRIWITADHHAKLLDFPVPSAGTLQSGTIANAIAGARTPARDLSESLSAATPERVPQPTPQEFLSQFALSAVQGRLFNRDEARAATPSLPLPVHAREFLTALGAAPSLDDVVARLKLLLPKITLVSRARRLALVASAVWFPIFLTVTVTLLDRRSHTGFWWNVGLGWLYGVVVVVLPCFLAALLFRGGALFLGLGLALVRPHGPPASRPRILWRNFVAFLPYLLLGGAAGVLGDQPGRQTLGTLFLASLAVLTLVSLLLPGRSLQDRLAGTYLVPR